MYSIKIFPLFILNRIYYKIYYNYFYYCVIEMCLKLCTEINEISYMSFWISLLVSIRTFGPGENDNFPLEEYTETVIFLGIS